MGGWGSVLERPGCHSVGLVLYTEGDGKSLGKIPKHVGGTRNH